MIASAPLPVSGPARLVWRITAARHAATAFSGEGARLYGGRWNHPGVAVVYCSSTLSLAALEYFVQLEPDLAPPDLVAVAAELPAGAVRRLDPDLLPPDWRSYPAPERVKDLGTAWVRSGASLTLAIPSAVIPIEENVLVNPAHHEAGALLIHEPAPFSFDPRMWKGR